MQVLLFRALKDANVPDDTAATVVKAIEEHVDMAVGQANKALEGKLDGVKTSIDGLRFYLQIVGAVIAASAVLTGVATVTVQLLK